MKNCSRERCLNGINPVPNTPGIWCCLTPYLTGAGARSAEGAATGHKNSEAMACNGVRVEGPVRLRCVNGNL